MIYNQHKVFTKLSDNKFRYAIVVAEFNKMMTDTGRFQQLGKHHNINPEDKADELLYWYGKYAGNKDYDNELSEDGSLFIIKQKKIYLGFLQFLCLEEFIPYVYHCFTCNYHTDERVAIDRHMKANSHRERCGLPPLSKDERYSNTEFYFHCACCNHTPANNRTITSIKLHMKSNKHKRNCLKTGTAIDQCLQKIPRD